MFNLKQKQAQNKLKDKQKLSQFLAEKLGYNENIQESVWLIKVKPWLFVAIVGIISFLVTLDEYTLGILPDFFSKNSIIFYFLFFFLLGGYKDYWLVLTNYQLWLIQRNFLGKLTDKIVRFPLGEVLDIVNKKTFLSTILSGTHFKVAFKDKKIGFYVLKPWREEVDRLVSLAKEPKVTTLEPQSKFCPQCGQRLIIEAKFCNHCRHAV